MATDAEGTILFARASADIFGCVEPPDGPDGPRDPGDAVNR